MAVSITAAELSEASGIDDETVAERLLPVATALVERFAPSAPEAVQNEAVVRFSGYMHLSSGSYGALRRTEVGSVQLEYQSNAGLGFRNSGAGALLGPWRGRRAGAI